MIEALVPNNIAIAMGVLGILILGYNPMQDMVHAFYAVQLGLNTDMDHRDCHGFVWFEAGSDQIGAHRVPFTVDRVDRLIDPKRATIMSIWRQLYKAGLKPKSIEIRVGGTVRIYRRNATRPIMVY